MKKASSLFLLPLILLAVAEQAVAQHADPTGVVGGLSPRSGTGGGYSPYSMTVLRTIEDISVSGGVSYPASLEPHDGQPAGDDEQLRRGRRLEPQLQLDDGPE